MHPPIRFVATPDGVRIAHCAHGNGPPLVFVRGWIGHLEGMWGDPAFRRYVEALAREFTVIRYDSRGQGLSDRDVPPITLDDLVADLASVMDDAGVDKGVLYGPMYGGPIVATYAACHPERVHKVVLDGTYACGEKLASAERRASIVETVRKWWPDAFPLMSQFTNPDDPWRAPYRRADWARRTISAETAAQLYELGFAIDVRDALSKVGAPVLVLHPGNSRSLPVGHGREVAASLPDASLVVLDGSAHGAWESDPAAALAAMSTFLGVQLRLDGAGQRAPATSGPVAILFTDIEGSTPLTQRLGDEGAQEFIRLHNRIVRDGLAQHAGDEISHTGDGIMAAFSSITKAVDCAVGIQRALAGQTDDTRIGVRIGINAGEPLHEEDDLFGSAVQAASRIAGKAQAGQILVSDVVRQLAAGKGFEFADRGRVALKGFPERFRLYEVGWRAGPRVT